MVRTGRMGHRKPREGHLHACTRLYSTVRDARWRADWRGGGGCDLVARMRHVLCGGLGLRACTTLPVISTPPRICVRPAVRTIPAKPPLCAETAVQSESIIVCTCVNASEIRVCTRAQCVCVCARASVCMCVYKCRVCGGGVTADSPWRRWRAL